MRRLKTVLAFLIAAAAAAAAVCAFLTLKKRKLEDQEELDSYLMESEDDPEIIVAGFGSEEALENDLDEWDFLGEDDNVEITFMTDPSKAVAFQDSMAKVGCSSTYDSKTNILDITLSGPLDKEDLQKISKALEKAMHETDSSYHGFAFI